MDLGTIFNLISAFALVTGLVFALIELRQHRASRKREAALLLLNSFRTADFNKALHFIFELPEGLPYPELEKAYESNADDAYTLGLTWESLGVLVCRGEISLDLVDDLFSGPIIISWRKLKPIVEHRRREQGRDTLGEWFQWLAERMMEREADSPPIPAYIKYREWKPED